MQTVGEQAGLDMNRVNAAGPDSTLYREAAAIIRNRLRRDLNWDPARGPFNLDRAVNVYFDEDLEERISSFMEERILYRTYANSVHIALDDRPDLVLIPSYALDPARDGVDQEELEAKVAAVYERAYPGAELVFINSDPVIKWMGAVHCTTLVLPSW